MAGRKWSLAPDDRFLSAPLPPGPTMGKECAKVKFESNEEFDLHVHKCFGRIFELLTKADAVIKDGAEKEESEGNYGTMSELRDWVEEIILQCHLAWQYHRLSKGPMRANTWQQMESSTDGDKSSD